jgi:predicted RecA/RadA family phage recombinase
MKTFVQEGDTLQFTVPAGGVTSGVGVKIGDLLVISVETNATVGATFRGRVDGVVTHAKLSAQAWTEGQQVNWDDTNKRFTTVTTGNYRAGVAAAVAANPSATGLVYLAGVNLGAALA